MHVLLFSDMPPCENYTAGIVLNRLCGFLLEEGHAVSCYTVKIPSVDAFIPQDKADHIKYKTVPMPSEAWGRFGAAASFVMNNFSATVRLPQIARDVARFARRQGCDMLWGVVQGQATIRIIRQAAKLTGIPYVVQAWDPSEWWLDANKFDRITKTLVMREYDRLIHGSKCFIAPSWAMAEDYEKKYGVRAVPVLPGLKSGVLHTTRKPDDAYIIAFAGQFYASDELLCLIHCIEKLKSYNGKRIVIRIYGADESIDFQAFNYVEKYSWIPQEKLIEALAEADLLYCPYGFSAEFKKIATLSFPSKLGTYLKAGKPVLFHGPEYSSPYKFLKKYDAAYFCTELDEQALIRALISIMEHNDHSAMVLRAQDIFTENLTEEVMKRNFFRVFNLPVTKRSSTEMRVLQINNIDLAGARFNGHDLQLFLNRNGIKAQQMVLNKQGNSPNTLVLGGIYGGEHSRALFAEFESFFSMNDVIFPYGWELLEHPSFQKADIVHYHLIHNNLISLPVFKELVSAKPSVWTLHDPWALSGHCVHSLGCDKWLTGCSPCEKLDIYFPLRVDKAGQMWKIKRDIYRQMDVDIIVASKYIYNMVKASPLTSHFDRVHLIPFGIDLNVFMNKKQQEIRKVLGIPSDDFVIFFRSDPNHFKGLESIKGMLDHLRTSKPITLITVGQKGLLVQQQPHYRVKEYGWVNDPDMLANLYAACDVFLMPSAAEAFGLMAIEAMASARPVIVAEGTSLPDVTFAPECGIVFAQGDIDGFAHAVGQLIEHPEECRARGNLGRQLAEKHYNIDDHFAHILALYQEILGRKNHAAN